jgi:hypothetical protein
MADNKGDTRVSQSVQDASGVEARQVKPTVDRKWADVKAELTNPQDAELHPHGEPEHEADRTSLPTAYAPIERPPVSTTKAGEKVLRSLVTGAGKHEPPDPELYDADGRPRDV